VQEMRGLELAESTVLVTPATTLRDVALYLVRHGWIQGAYYDATSGRFASPVCTVGGIGMVCYGGPVDAPAENFDDPGFPDFEAAVLYLDVYVSMLGEGRQTVYEFNDAKGRTVEQVLTVLHDAANEWDDYRAKHGNEVHWPGMRRDCTGCMAECFCSFLEWTLCVRCKHTPTDTDPTQGGAE
jgi:hypothetical protein